MIAVVLRALTPRETDVFRALHPYVSDGREFSHAWVAHNLKPRMTRQLFNLYLTKLTRAGAIVRIAPGVYVLPEDPRAGVPFVAKKPGRPRKPKLPERELPKVVAGVTMAMLMGGRARGRRRAL